MTCFTRLSRSEGKFFGQLPGEVRVFAAEVAIGGSLLEHGPTELQVAHQAAWAEVKVVVDYLHDFFISFTGAQLGRTECVHVDRERVRDTDSVGELHKDTVAETGSHQGLRHPAAGVCRRAVDLRLFMQIIETEGMGGL